MVTFFVLSGLIGSKVGMSQPACNKCKTGICAIGDSWCKGCSSLELSQGLLRQKWSFPGLRSVAEETLLSGARLVKAFSNLDRSLGSESAGSQSRAPEVEAAPARAALPRLRSRSPRRERTEKGSPKVSEKERAEAKEESEDYEEESEEEPVTPKRVSGAVETRAPPVERGHRGGERREHHHTRQEKSGKKRRRGGTKHQRHYREIGDPLRRSHRRLQGEETDLSKSFQEGLARRK